MNKILKCIAENDSFCFFVLVVICFILAVFVAGYVFVGGY